MYFIRVGAVLTVARGGDENRKVETSLRRGVYCYGVRGFACKYDPVEVRIYIHTYAETDDFYPRQFVSSRVSSHNNSVAVYIYTNIYANPRHTHTHAIKYVYMCVS